MITIIIKLILINKYYRAMNNNNNNNNNNNYFYKWSNYNTINNQQIKKNGMIKINGLKMQ